MARTDNVDQKILFKTSQYLLGLEQQSVILLLCAAAVL